MTDPLPPPPPVRWGRLVLIIATVIAVPAGAITYHTHQRFVAWSAERDAWMQKCKPYTDTPLTNPIARACNEELQRLTAIAKQEGWTR